MICNRYTHFHILDTRVYKSSRIHGRRFTLPVTTRTGLPTPTKLNFFSDFFRSPTIFTLAPFCRKRKVTIWRPSVRLFVCLSFLPIDILTVTHQGAACDAASVHLSTVSTGVISVADEHGP